MANGKVMSRPAQTEYNQKTNAHGFRKEDYLSVSKAGEFLKVSPTTMRRLESEGKIISIRQDNGYRMFRVADLERLKKLLENEHKQKEQVKTYPSYYIKPAPKTEVTPLPVIKKEEAEIKISINYDVIRKIKKALAPEFMLLGILAIGAIFLIRTAAISKIETQIKGAASKITRHNSNGDTINNDILGIRDRVTNFVFNVNVPAFMRNGLNVTGTTTTDELAGVQNIDETTETTLENLIDINGDVIGIGLNEVILAERE